MDAEQAARKLLIEGKSIRAVQRATGLTYYRVRQLSALPRFQVVTKHNARRVFGYTDIHWSDRDEHALAIAQHAQGIFAPDVTVLGGDLLNCTAFSRHPKRKLDHDEGYDYLESELKPANRFLDEVQRWTRDETVLLEGNHDEWFERWIRNTEGAMGLQSLLPSRYLCQRDAFRYVSFSPGRDKRQCNYQLAPFLVATHGWCAPKYAAQHHLDRAKDISVIFHHTHRFDDRAVPLFRGGPIRATSAGCLCKRIPMYAHNGSPTDWTHGFWVAFVGRQSFTVYPVLIANGSAVLPDGTEVRA